MPAGPRRRRVWRGRLKIQLRTRTTGAYGAGSDDRAVAGALLASGLQQRFWEAVIRFVLSRWRAEGAAGLVDRSSAPTRRVANRTAPETVELLAALRRLRFTAPELADLLDLPCSTISAVFKRVGMGKLGRIGQEPVVRYERARGDQPVAEGLRRRRSRGRLPLADVHAPISSWAPAAR